MLRLKILLPVLLISAAIPLLGAAPASAGSFTQCGDGIVNGSGWFNLRAKNVACNPARSLADHYVFEAGGNDDGFKGWSCTEQQIGDEVWAVKCGRGKAGVTQRAKFKYGA
ncbi:MAG: hypothetical protein QOI10_162 [Solirubrobacterales bacterium]|jgi:hypothetical protein|nr:hypothetical protein [Solirubrobacterales bacterium]